LKSFIKSSSHAVFKLHLHIVFVTKYRRKALNDELLFYLKTAFSEILKGWDCELLEFGGEPDHVHMIIAINPTVTLSNLVMNLKSASAKRCRNRFSEHLANFYWKPLFWTRAYYVSTVGGASLDVVKAYVNRQGTEEHSRKKKGTA
jgi:putative transposase